MIYLGSLSGVPLTEEPQCKKDLTPVPALKG